MVELWRWRPASELTQSWIPEMPWAWFWSPICHLVADISKHTLFCHHHHSTDPFSGVYWDLCRLSHLSHQPHTSIKLRKSRLRKRGDVLSVTHVDEGREGIWTKAHVTPPSHLFTLGTLGGTVVHFVFLTFSKFYGSGAEVILISAKSVQLLLPYVTVYEDIL